MIQCINKKKNLRYLNLIDKCNFFLLFGSFTLYIGTHKIRLLIKKEVTVRIYLIFFEYKVNLFCFESNESVIV